MNYSKRVAFLKPSAIRELHKLEHDPEVISFCGGYPDAKLFPTEALHEIYNKVLGEDPLALQYTNSQGDLNLRRHVVARMKAEGVNCNEDNIILLNGAQQGLDFTAKMLIDEGDTVITEAPTFLGGLIAFYPYLPKILGAAVDQDGLNPDALEELLKRNPGTKFLYTIPDFQNPTGVTLSLERRKRLVELANQYDFIILEDSPYRDMRYNGEAVAPIKSFDTEDRVIFLGSFSKSLVPGVRLGWAVAKPEIVQLFAQIKQAADTQCSTINMKVVSAYFDSFDHSQQVARLQKAYGHKKQVMIDAIRANFPDNIEYTDPDGGMFTWIKFPDKFDSEHFLRHELLPKAKVAYVPGFHFYPTEGVRPMNYARLSFSAASDEAIGDAITRMGALLHKYHI